MKKSKLIGDGLMGGTCIIIVLFTLVNVLRNLWQGDIKTWIAVGLFILIVCVIGNIKHKIFL